MGKKSWTVPAKTTDAYYDLIQRKREIRDKLKAYFPDIKIGDPIEYEKATHEFIFRFQTKII